ncbi:MAG TPA: YncE family protein, partial [Thermoanaerobaculia bacterium]|nr:YncE family protein [Thermoanaerobaculia bacterium]
MRVGLALLLLAVVRPSIAETPRVLPGPRPSGEIVLPNGRTLTPTGVQTAVASYPFGLALAADGRRLVVASTGVAHQKLQLLDAKTGALLHAVPVEKSWLGLVLSPDGTRAYLAGANTNAIHVFTIEKDHLAPLEDVPIVSAGEERKDPIPSGLALSQDGKTLWATRILADDVVRVDLATRSVTSVVPVGR